MKKGKLWKRFNYFSQIEVHLKTWIRNPDTSEQQLKRIMLLCD
jgi:hypothetical protein